MSTASNYPHTTGISGANPHPLGPQRDFRSAGLRIDTNPKYSNLRLLDSKIATPSGFVFPNPPCREWEREVLNPQRCWDSSTCNASDGMHALNQCLLTVINAWEPFVNILCQNNYRKYNGLFRMVAGLKEIVLASLLGTILPNNERTIPEDCKESAIYFAHRITMILSEAGFGDWLSITTGSRRRCSSMDLCTFFCTKTSHGQTFVFWYNRQQGKRDNDRARFCLDVIDQFSQAQLECSSQDHGVLHISTP
ncbi:hypothetical protein BX600DRAFT_430109 [Xylariales sp. PMI_506]|nr:hypothetical protein BX600DRAFT_430109 [Xylariales sp. PMI_506]